MGRGRVEGGDIILIPVVPSLFTYSPCPRASIPILPFISITIFISITPHPNIYLYLDLDVDPRLIFRRVYVLGLRVYNLWLEIDVSMEIEINPGIEGMRWRWRRRWNPLICISISITVMSRSSVRAVHMCIYVHVYVCTLIGVGKEVNRQL